MSVYSISVLVPFDMVLDTEIGLLRLVLYEYSNNDIFEDIKLDSVDDNFLSVLLSQRKKINPLSCIVRDKYYNDDELIDDLYKQFMEREYDSILSLSPPTTLFNLINLSIKSSSDSIKFTIWAKDPREEKTYLSRLGSRCKLFITEPDPKSLDLSFYGTVYMKNYRDLLLLQNIKGKNVYIYEAEFNYETIDGKRQLIQEITEEIKEVNVIRTINLHEIEPISG